MTDWGNREYIESVRLQLNKIVQYLNQFDGATRAHLSALQQRIDNLEKNLEQLDAGLDRISKKHDADQDGSESKGKINNTTD